MWFLSNKTTVEESGLFEGFRDWHCHLLPGVDDGVGNIEETMQILQRWEQLGVKEVWMTPHVMEDYPNDPVSLKERFNHVCSCYNGSIQLHLAAENMLDGIFVERLQDNELLSFSSTSPSPLLLVETSYYIPPINMENIIDRIKEKGYQPLLAHPERYQYMNSDDYRHWKQRGMLFQLNIPSIVGAYGQQAQRKAEWILSKGFYDCCGTDTHSADQMEFFLKSPISRKVVQKIKTLI